MVASTGDGDSITAGEWVITALFGPVVAQAGPTSALAAHKRGRGRRFPGHTATREHQSLLSTVDEDVLEHEEEEEGDDRYWDSPAASHANGLDASALDDSAARRRAADDANVLSDGIDTVLDAELLAAERGERRMSSLGAAPPSAGAAFADDADTDMVALGAFEGDGDILGSEIMLKYFEAPPKPSIAGAGVDAMPSESSAASGMNALPSGSSAASGMNALPSGSSTASGVDAMPSESSAASGMNALPTESSAASGVGVARLDAEGVAEACLPASSIPQRFQPQGDIDLDAVAAEEADAEEALGGDDEEWQWDDPITHSATPTGKARGTPAKAKADDGAEDKGQATPKTPATSLSEPAAAAETPGSLQGFASPLNVSRAVQGIDQDLDRAMEDAMASPASGASHDDSDADDDGAPDDDVDSSIDRAIAGESEPTMLVA